jgi:tetratricopeptide (TPR) repeat protein
MVITRNGLLVSGRTSCGRRHLHILSDFKHRSFKKLEQLGDTAVDAQRYDLAISHYSLALSLNPPSPQSILIKRSKARLETGSWKQAIDDANQVYCLTEFILVDPSSSGNRT